MNPDAQLNGTASALEPQSMDRIPGRLRLYQHLPHLGSRTEQGHLYSGRDVQ